MTLRLVTAHEIHVALNALLEKKGSEFVYRLPRRDISLPACRYEVDGCPSCGIGVMLHDSFHVDTDLLTLMDGSGGIAEYGTQLKLKEEQGLVFTARALKGMEVFQIYQDDGHTYNDAWIRAVDELTTDWDDESPVDLECLRVGASYV